MSLTPKEKAQELVDKMCNIEERFGSVGIYEGKECALIAVDEIIKLYNPENYGLEMDTAFESIYYWQEVKKEIEKL